VSPSAPSLQLVRWYDLSYPNAPSRVSCLGAQEELSATLEPPLLGGDAILEDGIASFKLRITVLSSLCRANRFRVKVACAESPTLLVMSTPMRTITKLRRGPALKEKEKALTGVKRGFELESLSAIVFDELDDFRCGFAERTLDELWEEVSSNGSLLLELQKQQRTLFRELRELRDKTGC